MPSARGYTPVLNHEKKKCIKSDVKGISLKLATIGYSDKAFLLTSKFCPCPGAIYMLNHGKICIKSDFKDIFLKLATNE